VYRWRAIPALVGVYLYADTTAAKFFRFARPRVDGEPWCLKTNVALSSFGEDDMGEIYMLDRNGAVYQLVPGSE
jgi:hypothetical protein